MRPTLSSSPLLLPPFPPPLPASPTSFPPSSQSSSHPPAEDHRGARTEGGACAEAEIPIAPLNQQLVHRLCSGQVIHHLSSLVKELLDNALDARARSIHIICKAHGIESISVNDDGTGIAECDRKKIGQAHTTSKLTSYEQLQNGSVHTLGFRGEAFSALCALARVSVHTKHEKDDSEGVEMTFAPTGLIYSQRGMSRKPGTTVSARDLFYALPVRREAFVRHAKREYSKMLTLVEGYALTYANVKIHVTHFHNGLRQTALQTTGSGDVVEVISSLYGAKQASALLKVDSDITPFLHAHASTLQRSRFTTGLYRLTGVVSKLQEGGRNNSDRRHLSLNKRPIDAPKLERCVCEAYRIMNGHSQSPFFVLHFTFPSCAFDVNVTPDKRQVMFHDEAIILAAVRSALQELWMPQQSVYAVRSIDSMIYGVEKTGQNGKQDGEITAKKYDLVQLNAEGNEISFGRDEGSDRSLEEKSIALPPLIEKEVLQPLPLSLPSLERGYSSQKWLGDEFDSNQDVLHDVRIVQSSHNLTISSSNVERQCNELPSLSSRKREREKCVNPPADGVSLKLNAKHIRAHLDQEDRSCGYGIVELYDQSISKIRRVSLLSTSTGSSSVSERLVAYTGSIECDPTRIESDWIQRFSMQALHKSSAPIHDPIQHVKSLHEQESFHVSVPDVALADLTHRSITKSDFHVMANNIIGQFNLGFIICSLNGTDLWIIDQHAADEKYRFEQLRKEAASSVSSQPCVASIPLQLTPSQHSSLLHNLPSFEKLGFAFAVETELNLAEQCNDSSDEFVIMNNHSHVRVHALTAVPEYYGHTFGPDDIHEILSTLCLDEPSETQTKNLDMNRDPCVSARVLSFAETELELPRLRSIIASRSCRSATMIGKALSMTHMHNIVKHMSEMDQPWNCPHGRPTLRHLFDTKIILDKNADRPVQRGTSDFK